MRGETIAVKSGQAYATLQALDHEPTHSLLQPSLDFKMPYPQ